MALKNILFLAPENPLDAFTATGVLANIIEQEPEARLTIVSRFDCLDFYQNAPARLEFLTYRDLSHWRERMALASQVLGRFYHRIIAMGDFRVPYILWAKHRHVFEFASGAYRLPHLYQSDTQTPPVLWLDDRKHVPLPENLAANAPLIVVSPGEAGRAQWNGKLYAELAWRLSNADEAFANAHMIVLAKTEENDDLSASIVADIEKNIPAGQRTILTGLSYTKQVALLQRASVVLGADQLTARMAATVQAPLVVRLDAAGHAPPLCPYNLYAGTLASDLASFIATELSKPATDSGLSVTPS
jgi:ADP-heptose:LPS heptosyltransferase